MTTLAAHSNAVRSSGPKLLAQCTDKEAEARREVTRPSTQSWAGAEQNRTGLPRLADPGRWFEKPQQWVSQGRQICPVFAHDLGKSRLLTPSQEAHLQSLSYHLGQSVVLTCREEHG